MKVILIPCSKCGNFCDLSSTKGRVAARLRYCDKCFCKEYIEVFKKEPFGLAKIRMLIPYLVIKFCYPRIYGNKTCSPSKT